jgi:serine phosphatase RsbU (regulator of sigma subunit)
VLGCLPGARYSAAEIEIQDQDTLVLYTDGVSEAANRSGEEFGDERLVEMLSKGEDLPPLSVCEQIGSEVAAFTGAEETLQDDRTLLAVRFLSNETIRTDYEAAAAMAEVA